jgi:holliday junction DNA helicase RuvB
MQREYTTPARPGFGRLVALVAVYVGVTILAGDALVGAANRGYRYPLSLTVPFVLLVASVALGIRVYRRFSAVLRDQFDADGEAVFVYDFPEQEEPVLARDPLETLATVQAVLSEHPEWMRDLEEMVAWEEDHPSVEPDGSDTWKGDWSWEKVHSSWHKVNQLIGHRLVDQAYKSRSSSTFRLHDRVGIREALEMLRDVSKPAAYVPAIGYDRLFEDVVGHDAAKTVLRSALLATEPVHVLLWGPPGSAKTLLQEDIGRLPNAAWYAGTTTSKAGLVSLLLSTQPKFLVLDQIDEMGQADRTPLLHLMEGGTLTELKYARKSAVTLPTKVFANANDPDKLGTALLSRFSKVHIPGYTPADFVRVAPAVLQRRYGVGPALAALISQELVGYTLDIRDAVKVAKLVSGYPEKERAPRAIELIPTLFPTKRVEEFRRKGEGKAT